MSTIKERARNAQRAHFAAEGDSEESRLAVKTLDLYDAIDALSTEDRALLVGSALVKVHSGVAEMARYLPTEMHGLVIATSALVAIAGYATEVSREEAGDTRMGDRKAEDILEQVPDLVKIMVRSGMSEEQQAELDAITERIQARVSAGEDFEKVLDEETAEVETFAPVPTARANTADDSRPYGLYL